MISETIREFIYALISTAGFSIIFNIPKDAIIRSSVNGAFGWVVFFLTKDYSKSAIMASFIAALSVSMAGEILARRAKKPATVFIIPGVVPLVPGAGMYYTMLAIIEKRFVDSANLGSETIFIAAAIASGIIIASSISRFFKNAKNSRNSRHI